MAKYLGYKVGSHGHRWPRGLAPRAGPAAERARVLLGQRSWRGGTDFVGAAGWRRRTGGPGDLSAGPTASKNPMSTSISPSEVPIFILCGGLGTRFKEETEFRPKPMIEIGPYPILVHIMRWYAAFGFRRFVLCMGYKSAFIRDYFLNFYARNHDATVDLRTSRVTFHETEPHLDWQVTLAYTGEATMTGGRIARAAERYLGGAEHFGVTYGDGLTSLDLGREWEFHLSRGKIGTVLGVNPPSRFGEFRMEGDLAAAFIEKPEISEAWINGGYFFFHRRALGYLSVEESCVLERAPLARLAVDGELSVYRHQGFWGCMDTQRDRDALTEMWNSSQAPWDPHPARAFRKGAS